MLTKWLVLVAFASACSGTHVVSVLPAEPRAGIEQATPVLIAIDASNAHLPLEVAGANVAYGDVERALVSSVERATRTVSQDLAKRHARPLELTLELVSTHTEYEHGRLLVRLAVRATLRERAGNVYLAQTHARANSSAATTAERGSKVVLDTTDALGEKLSGWLAGMDLR